MGRKLDLSGLSDNEAEHVLQVVQRDMKLRKKEEERLSELKQELDDEGSRCLLLSRQGYFNQRCCIRCCSPFTFLLNPKRKCHDCKYNVCKACRVYSKREKAWLCSSCEKSRLLKTQNLEWFYTNVKTRFKRFGSAKVLKTLYRKHLVEHSTLSELTEGSTYEESICNEGSISGSDSAFYRQSEEHSMEETLTVALRVAEEALDEAITKAEFDTSSQEKQNEAHYLREHKGELVEELAKTIVQKIINRRKTLADMRAEYVQDWPVEHNTDLHHHHQSASDRATSSVKQQPGLFRSHSAFSLLENDSPGMVQDSSKASMKEDGGPAMTAWKSVDRLDNAGVSAVLHSMDGNWIALQSAQLSRPSLLTKRKSQVYSALERESAVVSAYEGMGSDNDIKHGSDSSLGTALQEVHRKMVDSNMDLQDTCDRILSPLMSRRASGDKILSPMLGRRSSRDIMLADSEGNWKPNKPLLGVIKLKVPAEIRRPPSRRTSIIDMNFNTEGARQEENMGAAERSQQKKKSEKESSSLNNRKKDNHPPEALTPDTLSSGGMTTPEILELETDITGQVANQMDQELTAKLEQLAGRVDDSSTGEEKEAVDGDAVDDGRREEEEDKDRDEEDEQQQRMEVESDEGRTEDEEKEEEERNEEDDEEINYRLNKLITHSRLKYFSSTDEELDKAGKSEEEEEEGEGEGEGDKDEDTEEEQKEEREEKTNGFTFKLCQLEKESRAYQFSSTEDEMDRVGIEEKTEDEEENGKNVELAVKVCRLAYQVNANQFSSTEDELDSVGLLDEDMKTGEEEEEEEDEKKEELALKVCRLAHQVNASQFSSTEDELDRVGRGEEEEEGTDEEALWKLRAEKAVQAAHMRDLASLVGASEFSSTEDNLDKVGQTGQEVNKVTGSDMWENAEGNNQDKEESFEDLDVNMFDLRDEIEEKKKGSSDETVEEKKDGKEDGVTEQGEVLKDTEKAREAEMELKTVEEGKELIKVVEENQPGARQEDDKIEESNGSQGSWETAKDEENSEEYAEFDRIISSMLMMTLEDMQVQTVNDEAGENGGNVSEQAQVKVDENVKIEGGSGSVQMEVDREVTIGNESELMHVEVDEEVKKGGESELEHVKVDGEVQTGAESGLENVELDVEFMIDAQSTEDTKETESKKELESPNENAPQSYAKENPEANIQKQEESEDAKRRKDNEQGKETDPHSIRSPAKTAVMSIKEMLETYEAKQLCQRIGLHDDKQQDRGGKVSTMRLMMETQGDVTETKERMEETEGKKTYKKDHSRRSSLDDGLQTPEEIQMSSSAVQRIGLHDDKQDIGGKVSTMLHMMEAQSDIAETKERMEETKGKKTYKKDQSRRSSLDDVLQTPEEIQMRYSAVQRIGLHDDKQDIGGKVSTMLQMMEAQSDIAETKERMEETKGKKTYKKDQSRRSSLDDVLQTPEEIQMRYSAVQRIGLHDDKQDIGGKVSTMLHMMEAQSDVTETKERMEETKGKKTYKKDQSRRSSLDDVLQTPEEIQMRYSAVQRIGLHDEKQDIGGKVSTMLHMMEAQSDVTETKERMEETKGKKTYKKDQSRRSSLDDVLQTPEEIQMRYSAAQRIGLHDDKQDKGGKVSSMLQMMEAQSDVTEERMEETKGKKTYKKDQSRRSSLDDVLQTPEEIQMDSDMDIYKTLEFISTLLEQRYSAVQLRTITTEVLKVLNTTEDLLHGVKGGDKLRSSTPSLPPNTDPRKLDQQFSKLEENVYVAAGSVYSLEAELGDLEECARSISGSTSDMELSFLEEQVASAAAKVQQSDLQICDISARIAALKNAGLNVDTQSRPTKARTIPVMPVTLDSSRQFRRRLPAPPVKDKET